MLAQLYSSPILLNDADYLDCNLCHQNISMSQQTQNIATTAERFVLLELLGEEFAQKGNELVVFL